ncbi:Receptor-like cytosolic serine/threonine-protein kinase RBK1 [Sesamum alatum]|uniref:non-specific serine/threonine protein kinase n=1 Tax=Sesamum alatum TaxID=300844 RepID=A0AAE1YI45_9LAMI|nr:Receptor-like cytosolic serine/threonine-protein kinase RBK1 [Sesamum alatum]
MIMEGGESVKEVGTENLMDKGKEVSEEAAVKETQETEPVEDGESKTTESANDGESKTTESAKDGENKTTESVSCGTAEESSETPVPASDSDQSNSGSWGGDKSMVERGVAIASEMNYGAVHLKKLFGQIKRRSAMSITNIPMNIPMIGYDISKKAFKRKLGRNSEDSIDCDDLVVPKPSWRNFTYAELKQATDNFSPDKLLGKGGHAEVYKGFLPDGLVVAVKKITKAEKKNEDRVGDFLTELGIIAHIDHPNTAKLIGFSSDGGLHLVLQFSPHGSLGTVLHGSKVNLDWNLRYKVALGIAEGLKYLHCDCQRRIVHRDITASNILLSEDFDAQISDFGLAKWLPEKWLHHVVSPIEGTFGYMAPEYFLHGIVHEKTDVFAFGVLLLELITGRRAVDSSQQSLAMWAKPHLEQNNIKEVADPRLGENYSITEMKRAMFAAFICIHHLPNMRPNMPRVVKVLKGEQEPLDLKNKQKSMGMKALLWEACDLEDYTSATYLNDLNRHKELIME